MMFDKGKACNLEFVSAIDISIGGLVEWWIGVARLRDGELVSRGFAMVHWCREASRWWIGVARLRDDNLLLR